MNFSNITVTNILVINMFFITCLFYIGIVITMLATGIKTKLERYYTAAAFLLFVGSFSFGIMTVSENYTLMRVSWMVGFSANCLFFSRWLLCLTHIAKMANKKTNQLINAASVLTLIFIGLSVGWGNVRFVHTERGNQFSYQGNPLFHLTLLFIFVLIAFILITHIRWWYIAGLRNRRRIILTLIMITLVTVPVGIFTDYTRPMFTGHTIIPLLSVTMLPSSLMVFVMFKKFRVFGVSVPNVSEYIFASIDLPILVLERGDTIALANHAAVKFLGESAIGQNLNDYILFDNKPSGGSLLKNSFTGLTTVIKTLSGERVCDTVLTVERDSYMDTVCKIVVLRDITEEIKDRQLALQSAALEAQLAEREEAQRLMTLQLAREKELREAARLASQAKGEFLANINHEIRTPMNVIIGMAGLLMEDGINTDEAKDYLQKINTAGTTLMGIINDVLDISKIESGKFTLIASDYNLPSLIYDATALTVIRIGDKPITFKLDISDDLPVNLYGDELRLKQILTNLLSNAFKYTRKGSVTLSVNCVREGEEHLRLEFAVRDTGMGMKPEDLEKIFSDYNQVDTRANRMIEGTGLGLSIAKGLAELMDGDITAESVYGEGSVFYFNVKQKYTDDTRIDPQTLTNLKNFRYIEHKKENTPRRLDMPWVNVLVVDDSPTNIIVAKGLLGKYGMGVDSVNNGHDAIDRIKRGEPVYNAIFMDHMMPGMDGIETAKWIRKIDTPYAKNIPIIALTANALAGNERLFLDEGFQAFLSKPIDVLKLNAVLEKWVKKVGL